MFCNNCGTEFADTEKFCPNCGTPVEAAPAAEAEAPAAEAKKPPVAIICGAVVAVVVVVLLISLLGGGGAKGAVKDYFKAFSKGNAAKMLSLTMPKEAQESAIDDEYDMSVKEYTKIMDKAWETLYKGMKGEGKVKFEYEIKNIEKVGKLDKLKGDYTYYDSKKDETKKIKDLDDVKDMLEDSFDDIDLDVDKIKAAQIAKVKYTLTVDKEKVLKNTDGLVLIYKYKGDWYVRNCPSIYSVMSGLKKSDDADDFEDVIDDVNEVLEDLDD